MSSKDAERIASALSQGQVVLHPTEGVWGLAAAPNNREVLRRINRIKQAPIDKPVLLVTGCMQHAEQLLDSLPHHRAEEVRSSWPGHETWIFPHPSHSDIPWFSGHGSTIALRVTDFAPMVQVSQLLGTPFYSTSANLYSEPATRELAKIPGCIVQAVDYVAGGECGSHGSASRIRRADTGSVVRPLPSDDATEKAQ